MGVIGCGTSWTEAGTAITTTKRVRFNCDNNNVRTNKQASAETRKRKHSESVHPKRRPSTLQPSTLVHDQNSNVSSSPNQATRESNDLPQSTNDPAPKAERSGTTRLLVAEPTSMAHVIKSTIYPQSTNDPAPKAERRSTRLLVAAPTLMAPANKSTIYPRSRIDPALKAEHRSTRLSIALASFTGIHEQVESTPVHNRHCPQSVVAPNPH